MPGPVNIVLSGGGVNGIAHIGALIHLKEGGLLDNVKRIAGTSAGAFIGLGIVLDFTPKESLEFMASIDFKKFPHSKSYSITAPITLFTKFGIYSRKYIHENIIKLIKQKTGLDNPTFAELQKHKTKFNLKDFYVTATNMSKRTMKIFSHEHTPDITVADAIHASMAVPGMFTPMRFKEVNGKLTKHPEGDIFIDGGLLDNYPLDIFDEQKYQSDYVATTKKK